MTSASTFSEAAESGESPTRSGTDRPENHPVTARQASPEQVVSARLHGHQPAADQVRVQLSQTAVQQIEQHSISNLEIEVGGVLLGQVRHENGRTTVAVLAALPAVTDDQGPVHFTFTADAWAQIHQDRAAQYPRLDIVGWFHTHPNLGVFYSADDVVVHSAAFIMPWHIGLVIDPLQEESCLFGWHKTAAAPEEERQLQPINGYYELLDRQNESLVPWRFIRSSIWEYSYPASPEGQPYAPEDAWPALPPINPWWGVILGGLSLLISLILLIERLLFAGGS